MIQLKTSYFGLLFLYCAAIFWFSNMSEPPRPVTPPAIPGLDKLVHAVIYAGLTVCLSVGIRRSNEAPPAWVQWYVPVGFAILYGFSDEIHQAFVPKRTADPWDVLADATGAILAQAVLFQWWRRDTKRERENP